MNWTTTKKVKIQCPVCLGSGFVLRHKGKPFTYTLEEQKQARKLYREGNSLRDIVKIMGLKHAQTVSNLIKQSLRKA